MPIINKHDLGWIWDDKDGTYKTEAALTAERLFSPYGATCEQCLERNATDLFTLEDPTNFLHQVTETHSELYSLRKGKNYLCARCADIVLDKFMDHRWRLVTPRWDREHHRPRNLVSSWWNCVYE